MDDMAFLARQWVGPYQFTTIEQTVSDLDLSAGQSVIRFLCGAVCGSDVPVAAGRSGHSMASFRLPGWPMHEVLGEVITSPSSEFAEGDRVVGWAAQSRGLSEVFTAWDDQIVAVPPTLPDHRALMVQSVACVLSACDVLGPVDGLDTAVIGLGPFGLLLSAELKHRGARSVVGIDPVPRSEAVLRLAGVDHQVTDTSRGYLGHGGDVNGPAIVIDAVGHQQVTVDDAIRMVAPEGRVLLFGVPDEDSYVVPVLTLFRKNASLMTAVTHHHRRYLAQAIAATNRTADLVDALVTDVLSIDDIEDAFRRGDDPASGRLKVLVQSPDHALRAIIEQETPHAHP